MAKKLSLEDFLEYLEEDLAWRKKEITNLLLLNTNEGDIIIAKASILLIYSHWEGYVKNTCKKYLIHISDLKLKIEDLTLNFQGIKVKGLANQAINGSSGLTLTNELNLIEKIHSSAKDLFNLDNRILLERNKEFINTQDNLNLKILNSFCKIVGIGEVTMIAGREKYLDEFLLNQRNAISHGTKVDSNSGEFDLAIPAIKELRDFVFLLMEYVKGELAFYASNQLYLRAKLEDSTKRKNEIAVSISKKMKEIFEE